MDKLQRTQIKIKNLNEVVEMNIVSIQTTNEACNQRIIKIHEQLFQDQTKEVVVGYLFKFTAEEILNEIPYLFQQMEYKKICDLERRQILVILQYQGGKSQNSNNQDSEPVTLIRKAINKYQNDVIDLNKVINYEVETQMDFTKVINNYKNDIQVEAAPFRINDKIDNEELNKLYYICLRECEARQLSCVLLQVNKVNERIFTNSKLANRIFQILRRWEDSANESQQNINKDGNQSNK